MSRETPGGSRSSGDPRSVPASGSRGPGPQPVEARSVAASNGAAFTQVLRRRDARIDRTSVAVRWTRGRIDIWRNALGETVQSVRLTHFSDYAGFGASNPVVRPDGKFMAFQLRLVDGQHGNGHGIFLYDLEHVPDITATGPSHGD